ncbi:MAG: nuclear transport factor 2 family protein [Actinocatenispora sp.]
MPNTTDEQIRDLARRWVEAEEAADVATLDGLSTEDFTLVGPVGFVLDKQQWLDRYRGGALVTRSLAWDDLTVREYGDAAVVVGLHTQRAEHQGNPVNGQFRGTHIVVRAGGDWLLAGVHLSPVGGPPPFARPQHAPEGEAR